MKGPKKTKNLIIQKPCNKEVTAHFKLDVINVGLMVDIIAVHTTQQTSGLVSAGSHPSTWGKGGTGESQIPESRGHPRFQ